MVRIWGHVGHDVPPFLAAKVRRTFLGMLHTQSEEDSSAGRGMGKDFFQVLPENNREYSPGSFHRKYGRSESKAGEDSEWRAFSSTLSTQSVDKTFLQEWGGPSLATSRNSDSCHLFLQTVGGIILASPTTIWEVSPPPFLPKQGWGGVLGSLHNVEGFSEKTMGPFPT